jgi:hypothetical protein
MALLLPCLKAHGVRSEQGALIQGPRRFGRSLLGIAALELLRRAPRFSCAQFR